MGKYFNSHKTYKFKLELAKFRAKAKRKKLREAKLKELQFEIDKLSAIQVITNSLSKE